MNRTKCLAGKLGILLCSALLRYPTCGQPAVSVGVSVPLPSVGVGLPSVEIHAESDFYEPLTPQGEWVVIGSYGRCWRPGHVARDWRPYCDGYWQRTDAGWYWASEEPWAWATYHYGRWDFTDQFGWYWVPQTQWAPAWVSWHEGGGYVGWAPLLPSVRLSASGFVGFNVSLISPRAFVFVEERRFLEPVHPTTVIANNTTIIKKTVNITNIKVVNNTVINEGPRTQVIEQVSGRRVQAVPVRELRHKEEAAVVAKQRTPASASEKNVQTPIAAEVGPRGKKAVAAPEPAQAKKPVLTPPTPGALSPTGRETTREKAKPVPSQTEARPEPLQPATIKKSTEPKTAKPVDPSEKAAGKSAQKAPGKSERPASAKPVSGEKSGTTAGKPGDNNKAGEQQPPPQKPPLPPPPSP